ncbi:hypothetical protein CEXT_89531 [Caerostris extrusa]|uniref:Uncharacterized protein n=1 Tax=Caerostris extrusa TaxID=172846 RepID=A0AAV4MRI6_CAEEX|nr:hypothetical protein CEXT_89531 [Caerostris extrusa]
MFRLRRSDNLLTIYKVDLACKICTAVLMLYPLILYCSRLSENMCRIRETAACLIDQFQFDYFQGKRIFVSFEKNRKERHYLFVCLWYD